MDGLAPGTASGEVAAPPLVPQPHGGALLRGGNWGNKSGPGPVPSALRRQLRADLYGTMHLLREWAEGTVRVSIQTRCPECGYEPPAATVELPDPPSVAERLRAMDLLARYGLGEASRYDGGLVAELARLVRDAWPEGHTEALEALHQGWVDVIARHSEARR